MWSCDTHGYIADILGRPHLPVRLGL